MSNSKRISSERTDRSVPIRDRIAEGIIVVLVMLLGYGLFIYDIGGFGVRATSALVDLYTEHPEMVAWP